MTEVNQKFYPHEHGHHHHNIGGIEIDQDQVKPQSDVDPRLEFLQKHELDEM